MDTAPRSGCPINAAVEVLGDPWAMLVLRDNMFGDRRHFRDLIAGSEEGIATNCALRQTPACYHLRRMDIEYVLIADYAEIVAGKLYVMGGGWDNTTAPEVPAGIRMAVAVGVRLGWEETNTAIPVEMTVHDDDAQELVRVNGAVQVGRSAELLPGSTQLAQIAINLQLNLPTFGGYRVRVVAGGGDLTRSLPFRLVRRSAAS